ncbi:hypothetical protein CUD01_28860 [Cellulomonas uda]|uniref:Uncharacterized protein n=1 Tax=Cellulomonas uda TaxID=1714 RepID=A0A4Y3KEM8_CELUD|nr:hypothetical protein CUD01_28860 [Cellulomonas uda]
MRRESRGAASSAPKGWTPRQACTVPVRTTTYRAPQHHHDPRRTTMPTRQQRLAALATARIAATARAALTALHAQDAAARGGREQGQGGSA